MTPVDRLGSWCRTGCDAALSLASDLRPDGCFAQQLAVLAVLRELEDSAGRARLDVGEGDDPDGKAAGHFVDLLWRPLIDDDPASAGKRHDPGERRNRFPLSVHTEREPGIVQRSRRRETDRTRAPAPANVV